MEKDIKTKTVNAAHRRISTKGLPPTKEQVEEILELMANNEKAMQQYWEDLRKGSEPAALNKKDLAEFQKLKRFFPTGVFGTLETPSVKRLVHHGYLISTSEYGDSFKIAKGK